MTTQNNLLQGTLLAVDTSTSHMSVALARSGAVAGEINSNTEKNHSIHLLPNIKQLLEFAALHPRELNAFAVGVGPGSYTGVRIGVTVAKTFAWTHGIALIPVSSLEAMALGGLEAYYLQQAPHDSGEGSSSTALSLVQQKPGTAWVIPMIEARRGQAFTALYQVTDHRWSCVVPDGIRLMASWTEQLLERAQSEEDVRPERIVFVGETKLHKTVLQSFFDRWHGVSADIPHELRASHLAELGLQLWQEGRVAEPHSLVPNYTQLTEAEANLLAQQKASPASKE
ncbi:tRNA (adenosine(37)-N6)-threonylcarbamoyltransferase complex dimerization subunit type 1 TsaB [Paenibacillus rigui]|uniref:tRNA (Adenosine(37)-N6)-threonylcarbamoyltransferase complex dimerization subunit type 1 TsaB n=1 Tax=Paenibacillus rigui TaxID=554312 RepID=A0A229ULW7_9BACL|nr:tRNA (adenosine(37)-N6)-threonylcarbamoyltransferase complex dimerization subunit type 1 TsaB [Paenibacillus rigui]OXM84467.1 tRNA (adenosine(37)-N6)-threonylcarbamoyltransferase complex dimerization subunit type 1 TsaB [Paenibacillus rigui]